MISKNNIKTEGAPKIKFHCDGDIGYGQRRKRLEDRYFAQDLITGGDLNLVIGIIADGVGGGNAGELASQMTVDRILAFIKESAETDIEAILDDAIHTAHEAVREAGLHNHKLKSMATTVTVAVIFNNKLYVGHVGDSRAYLIRENQIRQLTLDHSWANEMIRQGKFQPDEVENHPKRDDLGRYIGQPKKIPLEVDLGCRVIKEGQHPAHSSLVTGGLELQPGDVVILCSDGLIKERQNAPGYFVEDHEIVDAVRRKRNSPEDLVNTLISRALGRQTDDNVSVVALVVPGGKESALPLPAIAVSGLPKWVIPVAAVALVIIVGVIAVTLLNGSRSSASPQPTTTSNQPADASSMPVEPGVGFARVVEGLAEHSAPGQSPALVSFDQEIQSGPDTKIWTTTGEVALELSDGSLVFLDKETTITLLRTYDQEANNLESEIQVEKGRVLVNAVYPVIVSASIHDFFSRAEQQSVMGMEYRSDDGYLSVDCLAGDCLLDNQTETKKLTQGQRGEINQGRMTDPDQADYESWFQMGDRFSFGFSFIPTPTSTPTPTATSTPTPLPTSTSTSPPVQPQPPTATDKPGDKPKPPNTPAPTEEPAPTDTPDSGSQP